jgi:hypothetical protein
MDDFTMDFDYFWGLIKSKTNFAFARYADGEVMLMNGQAVTEDTQAFRMDNWQAPNQLTKVGRDLLETLNHEELDYYYAISAVSDNINDYNFLKDRIKQKPQTLTFVNLWINANYERTKQKLSTLDREVVLICNANAVGKQFPFPVKMITTFPNDCINFWETNSEQYIEYLIEMYGKMENQLFFISCGPVSEIIIHRLYQNNPNNTYIDMGSSLDEYIHGYKTRPYMDPNSRYAKEKSHF